MKIVKVVVGLLLFSVCLTIGGVNNATAEEFYSRSFVWYYDGHGWAWTLNVPASKYTQYARISVNERFIYGYGCWDYLVTTEETFLIEMADALHNVSQSLAYSKYNEVNLVLAFVQCLPYTSDSLTTGFDEFPRFPLETLVDGGGDCEDTAILFASLLLILGYTLIFLSPPGHLAVGVREEPDLTCNGYYFEYNHEKYFYCETTSDGFRIGDFPSEFVGDDVQIIPILSSWQYRPIVRNILIISFLGIILIGSITIGVIYYRRKHYSRHQRDTFSPRKQKNTFPHPTTALCSVESCKKEVIMPFVCKFCGGCFCSTHRLPENHDCVAFLHP